MEKGGEIFKNLQMGVGVEWFFVAKKRSNKPIFFFIQELWSKDFRKKRLTFLLGTFSRERPEKENAMKENDEYTFFL